MEIFIITSFILILLISLILNISMIITLCLGLLLFSFYSLKKGFTLSETVSMALEGVKTISSMLFTFLLIGALTGLWRACGTIATIVTYSLDYMNNSIVILMCFLLNSIMSFLTGTSFGTAATMGSICMTLSMALNINPVLSAGAILSGIFFGDRCSFVSTSSLLVSTLTKTDFYNNMKALIKTSVIPFLLTCVVYYILGFNISNSSTNSLEICQLFNLEFNLSYICLLPAIIMLILSIFKIKVKITMIISIIFSFFICISYQSISLINTFKIIIFGFKAQNESIAIMINGGGLTSMFKTILIVCLSSTYSGIFKKTGLLNSIKITINKLANKTTSFTSIVITAIVSSMIACNQTLAIMLTCQICEEVEDKKALAIHVSNSALIIPALIPWSIACAVPLATINGPSCSVFAACYLYFIPIWNLLLSYRKSHL